MGVNDSANSGYLGAEVKITPGDELERHRFNKPTIVTLPRGLPQGHNTILKVDKPFIFIVVRPLSSGESKDRVYL